MMLADVRDFIESLGIADVVYMGKLDTKSEKSFGVYNSKHERTYKTAIGGEALKSYGTKQVTILVHWNKSPRETEEAAVRLFEALKEVDEETVNNTTIKFVQPLYEIKDVGTDASGIFEMVIEAAVIYQKGIGEE